ncbi:MAG: helix-turn-helix transcriptional regulator [Phormidesmis sp.]
MKPGSKYYPLFKYLQHSDKPSVVGDTAAQIRLTFSEIEHILQQPLPASARQKAWWSNRDTAGALQSGAWVQAGYHVKQVDLNQAVVVFAPFQAEYVISRQGGNILWNQTAVKALRKHMGLTQAQFSEELGVRRQTVSEWETGVYEPDRSTAKHLALVAKQNAFE